MVDHNGHRSDVEYKPIPQGCGKEILKEVHSESTPIFRDSLYRSHGCNLTTTITIVIAAISGFILGFISANIYPYDTNLHGIGPRIVLPTTQRSFTLPSPFFLPPPVGPHSGNLSEPIWDALVPNGLGYFKDTSVAPGILIPTIFHQLHCLYSLRRTYYSGSTNLEAYVFGKNKTGHISHCFDYLLQGLTCSADMTVESVTANSNDFEALKEFVEHRRVFNATGFLANGLDDGIARVRVD
ncbi:hypothetical protein F4825DRAFT_467802 [Nemania diffusa]|nr:hypothetical protein F4825DRAFT_467802 [Nemania diffusa]